MKLQVYVKKVREGGGVLTARILIAAARGIIMACERCRLVEFGGHVQLSRPGPSLFFGRMKFVKHRVTTAKNKHTDAEFVKIKKHFYETWLKQLKWRRFHQN